MNKLNLLSCLAVAAFMTSCGNGTSGSSLADGASGDLAAYESSNVNAVVQSLPTIMILPSDNLLAQAGALKTETKNGRSFTMRDYNKFLKVNKDNKAIISTIQSAFVQVNYPVQDLEQMLKQLDTQAATDMVDGLEKDAKAMLLTTAQPDMIIELDYNSKMSMNSAVNAPRNISYTMNVLDAYTSKVISSTSEVDMKGESTAAVLKSSLAGKMGNLTKDIQTSFSDILMRGREITVRLTTAKGCKVKMTEVSVEGDTYADWIVDYIKTHTVKGAYKMQRNTDSELYFVNCRIKLLNEDGTQYGVYDWTRDFCKNLRKNLGLKVTNKAQGLGEVLISIDGM